MIQGYKFIRKLGAGGFGKVILAEEELSGREVAIKSLHKNLLLDTQFILDEIKTISQLYHPNVVVYHAAYEKDNELHFVMEYCHGGSLYNRLKSGALPLDHSVELLLKIARGLDFIHKKGIIHHDIKPLNLLFSENGEIKIADFGVANTGGGTKSYQLPTSHQNRNFATDERSDIYALGLTFIEMLTGKHPLNNLSEEEIIRKLEAGDLGISAFPFWLQDIILKMLSINPNYGFKGVSELIYAVETRNIPFSVDGESIQAARQAKQIASLISRKKYYTLSLQIENLEASLINHSVLLKQLGYYYLQTCNLTQALGIFKALKQKLPAADVNKELGTINLELGNIVQAIKLSTEYILLHPDDCEAYNILLECYFKSDRIEDGHKLCKELISEFPKEPCFSSNSDLFQMLKYRNDKEMIQELLIQNDEICTLNKSNILLGDSIHTPSKVTLKDKLIFCHYSITKAKKTRVAT